MDAGDRMPMPGRRSSMTTSKRHCKSLAFCQFSSSRRWSLCSILEDDLDWDVNIKDITESLSKQMRNNPLRLSEVTEHEKASAPYGLDWDVLWYVASLNLPFHALMSILKGRALSTQIESQEARPFCRVSRCTYSNAESNPKRPYYRHGEALRIHPRRRLPKACSYTIVLTNVYHGICSDQTGSAAFAVSSWIPRHWFSFRYRAIGSIFERLVAWIHSSPSAL
jgi:hypothetical protein